MLTNKNSEAIEALDLAPIKMKLMHVESGEGWTREKADAVEIEYKRFLYLTKKYPDEELTPTMDVDMFWHYHILDTMKYAKDCQALFGYFLHHYPYVGLGENADPVDHARAGEHARKLYEAEFGSSTATAWCAVSGKQAGAAWCAVSGKQAGAAWCAVSGKQADAAWCAVSGKQADAAWCAVSGKQADAAWCAVSGKQADAAWCAVSAKPLAEAVRKAWCAAKAQPMALAA